MTSTSTRLAAESNLASSAPTNGAAVSGLALRLFLRAGMGAYVVLLRLLGRVRAKRVRRADGDDILVTANFQSPAWGRANLEALSQAARCRRLRIVATKRISDTPGIEVIMPSPWLMTICGSTVARLLTFTWIGIRTRPDVVGGFHLLFNGLLALLVARAAGARSLYVCVGGPIEIEGGGIRSENRLFGLLSSPDESLERRLLEAAREFDVIVTMGTRAATFFARSGAANTTHVIPCGVARRPRPESSRDVDVIFVGRLAPIKRVDLFVDTIRKVAESVPSVRAVVVGEGGMRARAESLARQHGVERHITFLGHVDDPFPWLFRAKVLLLPSDSEGVSISLLEAMQTGAVPVVSNVGDLGDVVEHGRNGFLIDQRTGAGFAEPILELLARNELHDSVSAAARRTAQLFEPAVLARRWDVALGGTAQAA